MSVTVSGKRFDRHVPDIQAALDAAMAEHLVVTQGKLAKDAPKDTGRFASSWYISQNQPSTAGRPDGWAAPGSRKVDLPSFNGKITFSGDWYIANNLPYAERVCYDPIWAKGGAGGAAWFTTIAGQQDADFGKRIARWLRRVG